MLLLEAVGDASVEDVWRRWSDPALWSTWAPQIRGVDGLAAPLRPGDRGRVRGPVGLRVRVEVLSVDPSSRTWRWRVGAGPVGVLMDHGADQAGDRSRAWVQIHLPRPLALPYVPVASAALRRLVRR